MKDFHTVHALSLCDVIPVFRKKRTHRCVWKTLYIWY